MRKRRSIKQATVREEVAKGNRDVRALAARLCPVTTDEEREKASRALERSRLRGILAGIRKDGTMVVVCRGEIHILNPDDILNAWALDAFKHGASRHNHWSVTHNERYEQLLLIIESAEPNTDTESNEAEETTAP